jgi:hypothetical protein
VSRERTLRMTGEVIETVEGEGRQIAKIALKQCTIELEFTGMGDFHLGDSLTIDAEIKVLAVRPLAQT